MTDVRTLIEPLFPGATFEDADRVYVEKTSIPVGPTGSQTRYAAENIFRGETFADDDLLVVETDRRAMADDVVLPGELTSDDFDGPAGPVNDLIWKPQPLAALDGEGHVVFPGNQGTVWLELLNQAPMVGRSVGAHWTHFGNVASGLNNSAVLQVRLASSPANYYVQMGASGNGLRFYVYSFGATQTSIPLDQTAHAHWRVRFADQLYFETSADGSAWVTRWTRPLPGWADEPTSRRIGSGPWQQPGGNSADGSVLDAYAETAT